MKKCKYSVSGKHLWVSETIKNDEVDKGIHWQIKVPVCWFCRLHDDRKVKIPSNKPIKYKYGK